jgi:ferritin-like metal-binding protein YciE
MPVSGCCKLKYCMGFALTDKNTNMTKQNSPTSGRLQAGSETATGLRALFTDCLKDLYWAEKAITGALPSMISQATSADLKQALQHHLDETNNQVSRLEKVFGLLEMEAEAKPCAAMQGILKEGNEIMEETAAGYVRDAGIIAACQKVEHYEIASYGTVIAFAKTLGETDAATLLQETLDEEKQADDKLSEVAELSINTAAAGNEADQSSLEEVVEATHTSHA